MQPACTFANLGCLLQMQWQASWHGLPSCVATASTLSNASGWQGSCWSACRQPGWRLLPWELQINSHAWQMSGTNSSFPACSTTRWTLSGDDMRHFGQPDACSCRGRSCSIRNSVSVSEPCRPCPADQCWQAARQPPAYPALPLVCALSSM